MSKLTTASVIVALGLFGAATVAAQETPPPRPSTHPAEGTAGDRTKPGETPTQDAMPRQPVDPRPSTSPAEGTAADRTPPGRTPTTQEQMNQRGQMDEQTQRGQMGEQTQRGQMGQQMGKEMIGASVVSAQQAPVGRVVDMVFDASNQPEFVVIESEGKTVAVPYSVANANKSANKIVIDESRLQSAPRMKQGEWRSKSDSNWKNDAKRHWDRG